MHVFEECDRHRIQYEYLVVLLLLYNRLVTPSYCLQTASNDTTKEHTETAGAA